ncbi:DUF4164 domain-containing protein [Alsobacter sp. SYSU M60028]|uniref:DUF4164 domain-containing protein n=1 Tax=Alsobacter ponti TaxID=2962936 RepID=A0ABT1LF87_9HYPH|nr:DUF4164 domain-containing protein [Alsobacter ponti]MCP8940154.1 DUF4164 domain-containing protein [Alsobacter ponti]
MPLTDTSPPTAVDEALARLSASLSVLEAAVARRLEADRSKGTLETELALMQDDRARLAVELDGALARANRLEDTAGELAERIDRAIGSVRAVVESASED